jgi:hypothetical protein
MGYVGAASGTVASASSSFSAPRRIDALKLPFRKVTEQPDSNLREAWKVFPFRVKRSQHFKRLPQIKR